MLGLDFGTTNSAIALAQADGSTRLAAFSLDRQPTTTFRSVLYFNPDDNAVGRLPRAVAGPQAIEAYRDAGAGAGGRFIQSLKSFLASRLFDGTYVFGWKFTLEDLIAIILSTLRAAAVRWTPSATAQRSSACSAPRRAPVSRTSPSSTNRWRRPRSTSAASITT